MKTFHDILTEKKEKTFTLDQINAALVKIGIGPRIVIQFMNALNLLRGLGVVEGEDK